MKIAVLGVGHTPFGELWDKSIIDLMADAQYAALADAHMQASAIEYLVVGNMAAGSLLGQNHLATLAAQTLNIQVPAYTVEGACASGSLALHAAIQALQSGSVQVAMVTGVEKLMDSSIEHVTAAFMGASNCELERFVGASFPGVFALIVRAYQHKFGITDEQIAAVSIKNHAHGKLNPVAHLRKNITLEDVKKAPMIADPMNLLHCSPVSDGAACLIIATQDYAQRHGYDPVYITGCGVGIDTPTIADRATLYSFPATTIAAQQAYKQAGVGPDDIHVAEVHDAFSLAEIIALEDLGFFAQGQAAAATEAGQTQLSAQRVVNPSGGLKARGHPVGATGIAQAVEIVLQLRGSCGPRQVLGARIGLTHNMGGVGTSVVVCIFAKEKDSRD